MKNKYKIVSIALASLSLFMVNSSVVKASDGHNIKYKPLQIYSINHIHRHAQLRNIHHSHKKSNNINKNGKEKNHFKFNDNKEALHVHDTKLPKKPEWDYNHEDIKGMTHFIKIRKPFHYTKIGGNTRDLGGYLTNKHHHMILSDRIIRSADLNNLSSRKIKELNRLHINKIVDLRYKEGKNGIQGHPDPNELNGTTLKGTHIKYEYDPIYTYDEAHQFYHYLNDHNVHGEYYFYGAPSVTEPQAIKAYRQIFKDLLNNKSGAILFHCNLGRDRTGTTSALILSALGINRKTIYHDYLLTDHYHYKYHHNNIEPYSKQAGELSYFFKTINNKYGSVNNYLHGPLELSTNNIHKLRSMYLEPNKGKYSMNILNSKHKKGHKKFHHMLKHHHLI